MKIQQLSIYTLAILLVLQVTACKDDDDNNRSGDNEAETFQNSCCKAPPQVACIGGVRVYIPNAFTPNGDGINDLFFIQTSQGIQEVISFRIFDGDNTLVFEEKNFLGSDPNFGWDGTQFGHAPEHGLFNYEATISTINGASETLKGQVCSRVSNQTIPCVDLEKQCAYGLQHDGDGGFDFSLSTGEDCE